MLTSSITEARSGNPDDREARPLPDLVVIDLLGALILERPRVAACLDAALSDADLATEPEDIADLVSGPVGPGLNRLISRRLRLAPEVIRPLVSAVLGNFQDRFLDSLVQRPALHIRPGAATLLTELAAEDIHIGVDSELDGMLSAALIRHAGWAGAGLIEAVVGSDEVLVPRPGPGQIEEIRRRCGLGADVRIAKVVSTANDAQAARTAHCSHIYSITPDLVVGLEPVGDLGELTERILQRELR